MYRPGGKRIGCIDHFMVDKQSGQVRYAVMRFSDFLGLGEELRPLPWDALEYSRDLQGYVVSADEDRFRNSPFIEGGTAPDWDSAYGRMLYDYWGVSW